MPPSQAPLAPSAAPPPARLAPASALRSAELSVLLAVQRAAPAPAVAAARALGRFGDHAAGWLVLGAAGALLDRGRRREWVTATGAVLGAHAATVVVKRVLRRQRPSGPGLVVHARTPGRLSFPSSHAASTTAAAVAYGALLGVPAAPVLPAVMGASRLVLGLHFPTDVLVGTAVGALAGRAARASAEGRR